MAAKTLVHTNNRVGHANLAQRIYNVNCQWRVSLHLASRNTAPLASVDTEQYPIQKLEIVPVSDNDSVPWIPKASDHACFGVDSWMETLLRPWTSPKSPAAPVYAYAYGPALSGAYHMTSW